MIEERGAHLAGQPAPHALLGRAQVFGTDWTVVIQQPVREIYRSAIPQAWLTVGLMLAAFAVTALLTGYRALADREATIQEEIQQRTRAEQERDQLFELGLDMLCVADFAGYFGRGP